MKYGNKREIREKYKKLLRLLAVLRGSVVLVEGKRDKKAMEELGCGRVITIAGRVRGACEGLRGEEGRVVIATDFDRSGNELARMAREELEGCSLDADSETRVLLARILRIRYFEDAKRSYDEFMEEIKTNKIG